jgi:hypothetical protein
MVEHDVEGTLRGRSIKRPPRKEKAVHLRRLRPVFAVVMASLLLGGTLTLTADVSPAAGICGNKSVKYQWEYWAIADQVPGPELWARYTLHANSVCWNGLSAWCGSTTVVRNEGNHAYETLSKGCINASGGRAQFYAGMRVKMICPTFPFATVYGYVDIVLEVRGNGSVVYQGPYASSNACYNGWAGRF